MEIRKKELQAFIQKNKFYWCCILIVLFSFLRSIQTRIWEKWFGFPDFPVSLSFFLFLIICIALFSFGMIAVGIVWFSQTSWAELGWRKKNLRKALSMGLLGFVLLYINTVFWAMLKGSSEPPQVVMPSAERFVLVMLFAFGLASWVEENLFRGYLQSFLSKRMGVVMTLLLQATAFSIAHLGLLENIIDFVSTLTAGLILGWLRVYTSNLVAPFLAHGLFWMMGAFMILS